MKKAIIIILIAVVAATSVFASAVHLGFMQSMFHTSFITDVEGDRFGVEGAVGIPFFQGVFGAIDYAATGGKDDEGNPKDFDILEMFLLPSAMVNGYWKVVDGKVFGFRLGLEVDAMSILDDSGFSVVGLLGISMGLNFKFNDRFSMNLSGCLPAGVIANLIAKDAANYTVFAFTTKQDNNWDFLMIIPTIYNSFARLSFKWALN